MTEDAIAGFFVGGFLTVLLGNLWTLLLIGSWRAYFRGRRTPQGAPLWASYLLALATFATIIALALFMRAVIRLALPLDDGSEEPSAVGVYNPATEQIEWQD